MNLCSDATSEQTLIKDAQVLLTRLSVASSPQEVKAKNKIFMEKQMHNLKNSLRQKNNPQRVPNYCRQSGGFHTGAMEEKVLSTVKN